MDLDAIVDSINSQSEAPERKPNELDKDKEILEQSTYYEKRIYDLEQLLDIAKSFCSTLDFSNLLESIVYICMAQMHVLGAEIFVRDPITNDVLNLETKKHEKGEKKLKIPVNSPVATKLLAMNKPVTISYLKNFVGNDKNLKILESLSPTLIIPLVEKTNHLSGILILQERIAIEEETTYT